MLPARVMVVVFVDADAGKIKVVVPVVQQSVVEVVTGFSHSSAYTANPVTLGPAGSALYTFASRVYVFAGRRFVCVRGGSDGYQFMKSVDWLGGRPGLFHGPPEAIVVLPCLRAIFTWLSAVKA